MCRRQNISRDHGTFHRGKGEVGDGRRRQRWRLRGGAVPEVEAGSTRCHDEDSQCGGSGLVTWAHLCHCGSPEAEPWAFSSLEPRTFHSAGSQIASCTADGSALCHWVSRQQSGIIVLTLDCCSSHKVKSSSFMFYISLLSLVLSTETLCTNVPQWF